MMQNSLFLRRLRVVTRDDKVAYDEAFHKGINIIRGQNSSGKSTITLDIIDTINSFAQAYKLDNVIMRMQASVYLSNLPRNVHCKV